MKRQDDGKPITITFKVKKEERPALHNWLSSMKWGEKSSVIRDVLEAAARSASIRQTGLALVASAPVEPLPQSLFSNPNNSQSSLIPPAMESSSAVAHARNLKDMDAIVVDMGVGF